MLLPTHSLSLILSAAGLLCLVPAVLRRAPWGASVRMLLDLWTAAGLLRLSPEGSPWRALVIAAMLVAFRYLVMWSLRTSPWARRDTLRGAGGRP